MSRRSRTPCTLHRAGARERFAATGRRADLLSCATLLRQAPDEATRRHLMDGFEQAFRGRAMDDLPAELTAAIEASGITSLAVDVRRGKPTAIDRALEILADKKAPLARRSTYAYLLADLGERRAVPVLLAALRDPGASAVSLRALQSFDDPGIGAAVLQRYPDLPESAAEVARILLAARASWSGQLLAAIDRGTVDAATFAAEDVARLRLHRAPRLRARVDAVWGKLRRPSPARVRQEIERVESVLAGGRGDPYAGKKLFLARCATCHRLFADGGALGPDLTPFDRTDVGALLLAIVDPGAEVREGYERVVVTMRDGRMVLGSKADEDPEVLVLRGDDGRRTPLAKARIESTEPIPGSLMPPGLLHGLDDAQVRALFGYLRTTQPQVK